MQMWKVFQVSWLDSSKRGHVGHNKSGKTRMGRHSRKLDDFYTARMIATIMPLGKYESSILALIQIMSWELSEYTNLPLPPSVKEDIREQFAAGITIEHIMDSECFVY